MWWKADVKILEWTTQAEQWKSFVYNKERIVNLR